MKTTSVLQLLLILTIFVSFSIQQAQNPNCQPIEAKKEYDKTLFVFLVETFGLQDEHIKYVMKQIACTIPETKNIKSYILDYTNETALVTVKEDDFSTSQQFVGKIANFVKAPHNFLEGNCLRRQTVQKFFSEQDAVKKYEEHVKYIIFMKTCHLTNLPDGWFLFNVFVVNNVVWYERDSKHAVALQSSESDAPQLLKDASKKIVGTILEDDSLWQTPAPSSSNNGNYSAETIFMIISHTVLVVIIVIFCIYVTITCIKKKPVNLEIEEKKEDKKKKKREKKEKTAKGTERDSKKKDSKAKEKQVQKKEKSKKSDQPTSGEEELKKVVNKKDAEKRGKSQISGKTKSTLSYDITLESEAPKKKKKEKIDESYH